jgi:hypothetical protein
MKAIIVFLCYLAAVVFFAFLVFGWGMGDVNRLAAGLLCLALGFALAGTPAIVENKIVRRVP